MALQSPQGFDVGQLRREIQQTYEAVAHSPDAEFHFHRGPGYAAELLGYDAAELAQLPEISTRSFAGVGNPLAIAPLRPGMTVLDHACGAGMDLLLAARRVGPTGKAIGVDMTAGMRDNARRGALEAGLADIVDVRAGLMEELPVEDHSVGAVISNGVVNLAPDKTKVFAEIARVLEPGGRLMLADVVVAREVKLDARSRPELWAACIGGALQERELIELARQAGLVEPRILQRFDCYRGTSAEHKVSADLHLGAVNFTAVAPS